MNLSTSSSERSVYGRIVAAILVGMALCLGILRLITDANDATAQNIMGRVIEAQTAIPQIASEPDDLVLFYGSSMTQAGVSPRQFDGEMAALGYPVKSFNFGFGGLNPRYQALLARRIEEAFGAQDRRLKTAVIEFNPFQATQTRWAGAQPIDDSFVAILSSPGELFEILFKEPRRGIRLLTIKYLRNEISAEMITTFFMGGFNGRGPSSEIPVDETVRDRLQEIGPEFQTYLEKDYPEFTGQNWWYPWQGGGTLAEERSAELLDFAEELYVLQQADYLMDRDRLRRIHSADIVDLNFKASLITDFIDLVKTFQSFSDQVDVVLLPRNTRWIVNPPEASARLQEAMNRIQRETGVTIKNFQDIPTITPEMFSDTTHLNRYRGAVAFTKRLVQEYAR